MLRHLFLTAATIVAFAQPLSTQAQSTTSYTLYKHRQATKTSDNTIHEYDTEKAAQAHCPNDAVVWLNTNSGIYHEKGMRWYGNTRTGTYVCRLEANAAGDRDTHNGQ